MKLKIIELKEELQKVREEALKACRTGDFMKMAKLTNRAAELNKAIFELETGEIARTISI